MGAHKIFRTVRHGIDRTGAVRQFVPEPVRPVLPLADAAQIVKRQTRMHAHQCRLAQAGLKRAAAIVKAVANFTDAKLIAELSEDLGEAMVGINADEIEIIMEERGR